MTAKADNVVFNQPINQANDPSVGPSVRRSVGLGRFVGLVQSTNRRFEPDRPRDH